MELTPFCCQLILIHIYYVFIVYLCAQNQSRSSVPSGIRQLSSAMDVKIFVGNITEGSNSADLQALFEPFGEVTECDIVGNYAFVVSI